jgi:tripartite-type tricarboxylate transporter receptor subunit TctC
VLPGFELLTWFAMYLPVGTPAAIVEQLGNAARKALADPAIARKLSEMGFETYTGSPAALAAFTRGEVDKWKGLVAETGIEQE